MIALKSNGELKKMKTGGKILARIMQGLKKNIKAGISTAQINRLAEEFMAGENVVSAFKGYRGFPASICVSVNEEIVHGIPGERVVKEGDIVSLDLGINYEGYFSDIAVTVGVGSLKPQLKRIVNVTKQALSEGIKQARIDNYLSDISYAIQSYVERHGFSVVREFVGHGIGRSLHEEPEIPNFGKPQQGPRLKAGMVFAIEPMVNMGTWESEVLDNGWTAVTKDALPSAHFEHTVAVTAGGPKILTN